MSASLIEYINHVLRFDFQHSWEGHLPLAATPDPFSAAPISGSVEPSEVDFKFEMSVRRVHEDPRVTKPYTDEQWTQIESLGHEVDRLLEANNVRLTMGGEPTFVSIDDMEGPEWNIAAMGPNKRRLAGQLFCRLADRFASGPLMHYGQGKWYPGEQLPRWALGCYWRTDGEPVWRNPELIAKDDVQYGFDETHADRFLNTLARAARSRRAEHYRRLRRCLVLLMERTPIARQCRSV